MAEYRPCKDRTNHTNPLDPPVSGLGNMERPKSVILSTVEPTTAPQLSGQFDPSINRLLYGALPFNLGLAPTFKRQVSRVAINFSNMDRQISIVECQLRNNQSYANELGNTLSTEMVKYYYFTVGAYVVFRDMIRHRIASREIEDFVYHFEKRISSRNLLIDGTQTTTFLALRSSDTENPDFQAVTYCIAADPENDYDWKELVFKNYFITMLPNVPLLLRAIRRQLHGRYAENQPNRIFDHPTWNLATEAAGIGPDGKAPLPRVDPGTGTRATRYLRLQPGFIGFSPPVRNPVDFANKPRNNWPGPPDANKPNHDWFDFFGFFSRPGFHFFAELAKHMSTRASYINFSRVLDDVLDANTGSVKIQLVYENGLKKRYEDKLLERGMNKGFAPTKTNEDRPRRQIIVNALKRLISDIAKDSDSQLPNKITRNESQSSTSGTTDPTASTSQAPAKKDTTTAFKSKQFKGSKGKTSTRPTKLNAAKNAPRSAPNPTSSGSGI